MYNMRESWTDARLDDFAAHVDRRFDAVDQRFDAVDRQFEEVDRRLKRVEDTLGTLVQAVIFGFIGMSSAIVVGFVTIATQL
jgi:hypothetical protein